MRTTPFGRTGLAVSVLGFGSAPIGYLHTEREKTGRILNLLLDAGVNVVDTAASYPGSEEAIAATVGHRRDEFILISKCGSKVSGASGVTGEAWSASLIQQTVERSLRNLQTDHLDVMLLHTCDLKTLQKGEALGALVQAQQAGKIRFVGYSGDNEAAAWAAQQAQVSVIETSISIADQANIDMVLPVARQHNVGVLVKRPIANAAWKPLSKQAGIYQDYAADYTQRLKKMNLTPADLGFEGDADDVWPRIALRFTLSQPGAHCAIIGTTNPANAQANLAAVDEGPLPAAAVKKLRAAFAAARSSGETWPGLT